MAVPMTRKAVPGLLAVLLFLTTGAAPTGAATPSPHLPGAAPRSTSASANSAKLRKPRLPIHRTAPRQSNRPLAPLLTPTPAKSLNAIFNGLNAPGLNIVDNGSFQTAPPDTTGSIGPNHYVEMVNSVIGVYHRNDLSLVVKTPFTTWLNIASSKFPCDPQIQWDPSSQRWLYVVLECDFGLDTFLYGWSKTPDPSDLVNGWCRFSVSTPGVLSDYPKLGHSNKYMLVGTNDYSDSGMNPFVTAQIFWMRTPAAGVTTCVAPTVNSRGSSLVRLKNGDGTLTSTPVPVNTSTNDDNGYVISAFDPSSAPQSKLAVFHIDGNGVFHAHSDITVNPYATPSTAVPDLGGSPFGLDPLDGRLTQAVGDPTTGIYTQHTINGAGSRSKVRWYEIQVASSVATLTQQGEISSATDYVFNGAISPRSDGLGAVIFYNRSSAGIRPVIATQGRTVLTPLGQMDPGEIVLATSTAGDNDFSCNNPPGFSFPCRWGDYSGASPDPLIANVVWGSNQALTTASSPGNPNWVTQNFAIAGPILRSPASQSTPRPTPSRSSALPGPTSSPGGR